MQFSKNYRNEWRKSRFELGVTCGWEKSWRNKKKQDKHWITRIINMSCRWTPLQLAFATQQYIRYYIHKNRKKSWKTTSVVELLSKQLARGWDLASSVVSFDLSRVVGRACGVPVWMRWKVVPGANKGWRRKFPKELLDDLMPSLRFLPDYPVFGCTGPLRPERCC